MRILLVQSYLGRKEKPIYPLGLAYLAAMLKGHELKAVDPNVLDSPIGDLKKIAGDFSPEMIGVSLRNADTTQIRDPFVYLTGFEQTMIALKQVLPDAPLVTGGSGFSIYAEELMAMYPQIDAGVFLEAEDSIVELVENWPSVEGIKGLYLRMNGETIFTGPREFREMRELPFPDWDTVPLEPYKTLLDAVGVQTKRGCGLKCAYCNYPFLNGSCYRFRDPESVGEEIERLVKDYGVERFIFVDSVFNLPRKHCEAVLKEIIRRKIEVKWTGWYNERGLDEPLVELALQAGCELFSFSPDGFSDETLQALGKNLRKEDILRVYEMMKKYPEALVGYNFFINPPGQTLRDLLKLLSFGMKVRREMKGRLIGFMLGSIRVEPDTPIYERALKEGVIAEDTRMAVKTSAELRRLFYKPPNSPALSAMLKFYIGLRKLKHKIKPPVEM